MITDYDGSSQIRRNADGTFLKGFSANPGARLSKGQKIVREYAVNLLPYVMQRLEEMFKDDCTPIDIRLKIACVMIERGAGKVEEAPTKDDSGEGAIENMSGEDIMKALKMLIKMAPQFEEKEGDK